MIPAIQGISAATQAATHLEEQLTALTINQNQPLNREVEKEKIREKILENGFSYEELRNYIYVLVDGRQIDTAIKEIELFEKSQPDTISFSFLQAVTALAQNKKNEAKKALIKHLDLHPFDMEAWVWLASSINRLEIRPEDLTKIMVTSGKKFMQDPNSDFTFIQKATVPFLGKDGAKFMQFSDSQITAYLVKESADPWIVLSMLLGLTSPVSPSNTKMVEQLQKKLIEIASSKPLSLFFQKTFLAFTYFSCRTNNETLPLKFFHALYMNRTFCMTAHLCFAASWMTIDNPFEQEDADLVRDMKRACLKLIQMKHESDDHQIICSIVANRHDETNTKLHQTLCIAAACEFDSHRLWQTLALQLLIEARKDSMQLIFAEFAAQKTLRYEPDDIKAHFILAEVHQSSKNSSQARKHYEKIQINKKTIQELETLSLVVAEYWLSQRQFQKSYQIDTLYLQTKGEKDVEDEFWHSYAQSCIGAENYLQAKYALTHAVRKEYRKEYAWFLFIVTCALLDDFETAKKYLPKCFKFDILKTHRLFWAISSVIYWKTGDKQNAVESQKKIPPLCAEEMQDLLFPRIMKLYETVQEEQKIDAIIEYVQDLFRNDNFERIAEEIKKIPFSHYNQTVIDIAFTYSWKLKDVDFACTLAKQFIKKKLTSAYFHWALGELRIRENNKKSALELFTKASLELPLQEKVERLKEETSSTTLRVSVATQPKTEISKPKPSFAPPKKDKTAEIQEKIASRKAKKEQVKLPEKKQIGKQQIGKNQSEKKQKKEVLQASSEIQQLQHQIGKLEIVPAKNPAPLVTSQVVYPKECSSLPKKGLATSAKLYLQWFVDTAERNIDPEIKRSSLLYYGCRLFEHLRHLDGFKDLESIRHAIRHSANQIALADLEQFAKAISQSDLKKSLKTMIEKNQHPFALSVPILSHSIELSDSELLKRQLLVCRAIHSEIGAKLTWNSLINEEGDKSAAVKASMLLIGKILSRRNLRANGLQKIIEAANKIAHDTGDLELLNYSIFDEVSPEEIKSFLTSYQQLENLTI